MLRVSGLFGVLRNKRNLWGPGRDMRIIYEAMKDSMMVALTGFGIFVVIVIVGVSVLFSD